MRTSSCLSYVGEGERRPSQGGALTCVKTLGEGTAEGTVGKYLYDSGEDCFIQARAEWRGATPTCQAVGRGMGAIDDPEDGPVTVARRDPRLETAGSHEAEASACCAARMDARRSSVAAFKW